MDKKELKLVRVMPNTKKKIERLSKKLGLKQVTVLEYLLQGKIDLLELK